MFYSLIIIKIQIIKKNKNKTNDLVERGNLSYAYFRMKGVGSHPLPICRK